MSFPGDIFSRMFTDKSTQLLYPKEEVPSHDVEDIIQTNIFNVMLNRRSQRKFENKEVEEWKLEMIFAAADTAPTAGGFQGFEIFHVKLNPGHLIHLDEWMSSPFYPGSEVALHSGMAIQSDVIPSHPVFLSTRMEDTFVLADAELRDALGRDFPTCLARCEARREFMRTTLGFEIGDEVLPLTNVPGVVSPYLLAPNRVVAL